MLSLVSCVCLGMCPGMWIVSIGIYLGVQVWSFISVLLSQRSDWKCGLGKKTIFGIVMTKVPSVGFSREKSGNAGSKAPLSRPC